MLIPSYTIQCKKKEGEDKGDVGAEPEEEKVRLSGRSFGLDTAWNLKQQFPQFSNSCLPKSSNLELISTCLEVVGNNESEIRSSPDKPSYKFPKEQNT